MTRPAFGEDFPAIAKSATKLAEQLPYSVMIALAHLVSQQNGTGWPAIRQTILENMPTPDFREAAATFLDAWHSCSRTLESEAVALALHIAAESRRAEQERRKFELVWTGPTPEKIAFRQTEQAILEVVNSATKRLMIVSYAVYRIPRVREVIVSAAQRGVRIRVIVETPNRVEGLNEYDSMVALGADVAAVSSVYFWPHENRPKDDNGKTGILHVKCAVADGHRLFLSSANLTDYAFTINMELGVLAIGGNLAEQVENHFGRLIDLGVLTKV